MKIDAALLVHDLNQMPAVARFADDAGFDGIWTFETSHEPFLPLVLAAEHSSRMSWGTSIAVAFARRPTILAQIAWDLARFSRGRFILGLGTQVKGHNERRFGRQVGKTGGENARGDPRRESDLGVLAESNQTQFFKASFSS
jgi:alkanesulfonate monooxygenase SsuD/methylene tetrahydromethanopterin reductase-like flavin-dependent oxidoreductase (luciferase family)